MSDRSDTPGVFGELTSEEWWRLNTALAHYEVHVAAQAKAISAFAHLVCQSMASAPLQGLTAAQICELLGKEFGGRWMVGEINLALAELERAEYVTRLPDPPVGDRFSVKEPYRTESIREQNETERLRDNVLEQWTVELRKRHPNLSQDERQSIVQDLLQFCIAIFDRRGAECVALIYSGEPQMEEFLTILETEDLPSLPPRPPQVATVRDVELLDFFRNSTGERSSYIGHFLRSSFLKNAIAIDPKFAGVLWKQFEGSTAVLDTNFLFSLFGLQGEFEQEVAKAAVQFSTELRIRLLVHRVSIREFRRSVELEGRILESCPMPSEELAASMTQRLPLQGTLGAYYKRYAATGVSWDDWIQPFLAIEARLSELGIEVTDMWQDEIERDERLGKEASRIYEISHDYYQRIWRRPLTDEICRHDAFLRLFTSRLRKGKPEEFVQAKAWCITRDGKLPRYERIERHRLGDIPVFVLLENWMHFVEPITPRTDDWNAFARSLLLSPFLRTPLGEAAPIERIHRAASCITEYRNFNAQLATRVLLNARFREAVRTLPEAEFGQNVHGVIEEALLDEYYKQEKQLGLTLEEKKQLETQLAQRQRQAEEDLVAAKKESDKTFQSEVQTLRKETKRVYAALVGAVLVLAGISIDWPTIGPLAFSLAMVGIIVGVLAIVGFLRSWRFALSVLLGAAAFASLLGVILYLRFPP